MTQDGIDARKRPRFIGVARGPAACNKGSTLVGFQLPMVEAVGLSIVLSQDRESHGAPDGLAAFARSLNGNAAGVDDAEVRFARLINLRKTSGAQQRGQLLALVAVDFAAECLDPESLHRT